VLCQLSYMGCSSPTQRLPWKPGRRTGRALHQRVKNPRVASNSHLNDHGIASSGKKRPQTNHAYCGVKEILGCTMQRARSMRCLHRIRPKVRQIKSAEDNGRYSIPLTNSMAGGLRLSARKESHDHSNYEQRDDADSDI
jgi:hypothetical protein